MNSSSDTKVFYVVGAPFEDGCYVVTASTFSNAQAEFASYEERYGIENWGNLRRSTLVDDLEERLSDDYDIDVEDYLAAIERSCGRPRTEGSILERLAALANVGFDGDDDANAPSDDEYLTLVGDEEEIDPTYFVSDVCARSTRDDLASVGLASYVRTSEGELSPLSGDVCSDFVADSDLVTVTSELERLGYTVIRE